MTDCFYWSVFFRVNKCLRAFHIWKFNDNNPGRCPKVCFYNVHLSASCTVNTSVFFSDRLRKFFILLVCIYIIYLCVDNKKCTLVTPKFYQFIIFFYFLSGKSSLVLFSISSAIIFPSSPF